MYSYVCLSVYTCDSFVCLVVCVCLFGLFVCVCVVVCLCVCLVVSVRDAVSGCGFACLSDCMFVCLIAIACANVWLFGC